MFLRNLFRLWSEFESNENGRKLFACIFWLSLLCKARPFSDKTAILNCSVFGQFLWVPTSQRMRSVIFFSKHQNPPRWPSCENKGLSKFYPLDPCFHENSPETTRLKHIVVKLIFVWIHAQKCTLKTVMFLLVFWLSRGFIVLSRIARTVISYNQR